MLFQVYDCIPNHTLTMLYYSFAYSHICYGIVLWGTTAAEKYLHEVEFKLNSIIQTITWNKNFSHVSHLYIGNLIF